jgi:hypothetical protein
VRRHKVITVAAGGRIATRGREAAAGSAGDPAISVTAAFRHGLGEQRSVEGRIGRRQLISKALETFGVLQFDF